MVIKKEWSVLTVGDGDLSFSRAVFDHYQPKKLTATILDSKVELTNKYGSEHLDYLKSRCDVITKFDITNEQCISALSACYDLVIFQFPLIPNFTDQQQFLRHIKQNDVTLSINTLNRRLLRLFLLNSFKHLLAKDGAQLAYISSKDVKPYTEWDIEFSLTQRTDIACIGSVPFDIKKFPGYKVRNVDRDKHVKDTAATTYIWTNRSNVDEVTRLLPKIIPPLSLLGESGCDICHAGPFATKKEKDDHNAGKKHKRMIDFNYQWQHFLANEM